MSDTQPAAEAVANDPAESNKIVDTPDVKHDAKAEAPTEAKMADATDNAMSADANGDSKGVKAEESSADRKEELRNDRDNGGRKKGDPKIVSGNKHDGDRFEKSRKPMTNEFESLPDSSDPVEIRAQVEFYFSVQNLATDEHLFKELKGPENRPVSIKHVSAFSRMRRFKPYSAIVNALRESEDLVVVDDGEYSGTGNEAVKRKEPLVCPARPSDDKYPPDVDDLFHRMKRASMNKLENSIYAKNFADEGMEVGQILLEKFFKPYGAVMVRKRRTEDKKWKGSVFVEFDSEDSQQQFLKLDPKPTFEGRELMIKSKKQYSEEKCAEKGITPAWLRSDEYTSSRGGRGRGRGGGGGRGRSSNRGRGGRGGRDGRYNDRRNGADDFGRDRPRHRSRRDRSRSRSSESSRDWNRRRDRFQNKDKHTKYDDEDRKPIERDANGIPVVRDTRGDEEKGASNKRKADDSERVEIPKKTKIEIKEDE
ncbi:hypothetical protein K458DRAFT_389306 [Lentithecium fluviatile CBS 122367]|uniref:RNA-binding La domain-containing protein n=1 Tax=Lentithecium fluviatile CBS 122367 TaxID=1168545 RepID=A0A6G1J1L3_9PLEO|nr:hypothetical protein K458DRAFT_389306 [Lentithecium fluviatile CBS 122367]